MWIESLWTRGSWEMCFHSDGKKIHEDQDGWTGESVGGHDIANPILYNCKNRWSGLGGMGSSTDQKGLKERTVAIIQNFEKKRIT